MRVEEMQKRVAIKKELQSAVSGVRIGATGIKGYPKATCSASQIQKTPMEAVVYCGVHPVESGENAKLILHHRAFVVHLLKHRGEASVEWVWDVAAAKLARGLEPSRRAQIRITYGAGEDSP